MTRSFFFVVSFAGYEVGATYSLPHNQPLKEVVELTLALLRRQGVSSDDLGSAEEYLLCDLHGGTLAPELLVRHVPSPGCLIAVHRAIEVQADELEFQGDQAPYLSAQSLAMRLMTQRRDQDDELLTKYAEYLERGFWRFDPTPITEVDIGISSHVDTNAQANELVARLEAKGLRCRCRIVGREGSSNDVADPRSPAASARALVLIIREATDDEAWLAYDAGVAWANGIPIVPVLVGTWTREPPDILRPYQRIDWEARQGDVVDDLVNLFDLTPWTFTSFVEAASPDSAAPETT